MKEHGMRNRNTLAMWTSICLVTALGALVGAAIFGSIDAEHGPVLYVMKAIEGVAGNRKISRQTSDKIRRGNVGDDRQDYAS